MSDERYVECDNCGTRFPERYVVTLPPHNCTERANRRKAAGDPQ